MPDRCWLRRLDDEQIGSDPHCASTPVCCAKAAQQLDDLRWTLAGLLEAGLVGPELVGTSGYRTSPYTEAMYIRARKA
jgi:hypothetical protein